MTRRIISYLVMCILSLFLPQEKDARIDGGQLLYQELVSTAVPAFSYSESELEQDRKMIAGMEYENKKALEQEQINTMENVLEEAYGEAAFEKDNYQIILPEQYSDTETEPLNGGDSATEEQLGQEADLAGEQVAKTDNLQENVDANEIVKDIKLEKLDDFDYLIQNYYIVDSSTTIRSEDISAGELLAKDLSIAKDVDGPQILIYHTHSQEGYADSEEGDDATSVVAVGDYLKELLEEQYGFQVLHHKGEYDLPDRDHAYSKAAPALEELLKDNPTIEVVIDLHRDSVPEKKHLVTQINGKDTAKIMFFNGLCRTTASGNLTGLPNPYLQDNLAFSLQMQIEAARRYPDLTRKIYLKGYRYNMHFCPKSLLVEVGAQNNSFEEAKNAMEPLAKLLSVVLKKEG